MASHGVARPSQSRTADQRLKDLEKIKKYRDLEERVRCEARANVESPELVQLTSKLLRLNPEYYTVWNIRRVALTSSVLSGRKGSVNDTERKTAEDNDLGILQSELSFTIPLLIESPKCYWIWNYRRWVLQQAIDRLEPSVARKIWEEELGLTSKMLTKDRRNFHAWGYRRFVVKRLESSELNGQSLVETEFEYTYKMIRVDLSNFSAWHNRSKLIPRLLEERGAGDQERRDFYDEELARIHEALNVGPEDQSLWFYHQFLVSNLTTSVGPTAITPNFTIEDRIAYLTRELQVVADFLEDYNDIKWIYEALLEYTLSLCQLQQRDLDVEERRDLQAWLTKLRSLDPMRNGRWEDMERDVALA
ncbi:hypothetical protein VTK73DRAFT_7320 [Phialemonium thermophilum]|uniref:Geranylgeranyl transferase type-2 subunit alpha n=1 Tax=Phialemonium thermophilum TaxID=223376 RepID=A0ABR3XSZ3_9PEZI